MKAELVPDNGDPPIVIDRDLTIVGRRGYCDVTIDDPGLSKRHCVLVKTDGLLVVRDLGSTNGTKVKGQRIRWAALLPDDRLTLGGYRMRVYLGPDNLPGPSEQYRASNQGKGAKKKVGANPAAASGFAPPSPLENQAIDPGQPAKSADDSSGSWRQQMAAIVDRDDMIIELD